MTGTALGFLAGLLLVFILPLLLLLEDKKDD